MLQGNKKGIFKLHERLYRNLEMIYQQQNNCKSLLISLLTISSVLILNVVLTVL